MARCQAEISHFCGALGEGASTKSPAPSALSTAGAQGTSVGSILLSPSGWYLSIGVDQSCKEGFRRDQLRAKCHHGVPALLIYTLGFSKRKIARRVRPALRC